MPTPEDIRRQRLRAIIGILTKAGKDGLPRKPFVGQLCVEYGCVPRTAEGYIDILLLADIAEEIGPRVRILQQETERERETDKAKNAKRVKTAKKPAKAKPHGKKGKKSA